MSLAAYQSVRRLSEAPRDTEHRLMGQITGEMIVARDAKPWWGHTVSTSGSCSCRNLPNS